MSSEVIEPFDIKKYDSLKFPVTNTWGVLMRKDSPLAEKTTIWPKDLWDVPILTSQQSKMQNELSIWICRDFESLNIVATYNLVYNASLMVEEGIGYALCLDKLVNITGDSKLCFRPLDPKLEAGLNIVWKKHQVFSKAASKFLKQLQEKFII